MQRAGRCDVRTGSRAAVVWRRVGCSFWLYVHGRESMRFGYVYVWGMGVCVFHNQAFSVVSRVRQTLGAPEKEAGVFGCACV